MSLPATAAASSVSSAAADGDMLQTFQIQAGQAKNVRSEDGARFCVSFLGLARPKQDLSVWIFANATSTIALAARRSKISECKRRKIDVKELLNVS